MNMTNLVQLHSSPPKGMVFYNSLGSVRSDVATLGYLSVIDRAWHEMGLDGVLFLEDRPILYLKENKAPFSEYERISLQRLFWNQGVANVLVLADPNTVYIYSGLVPPQNDISNETEENALIETLTLAGYVQRVQSLYHDIATGHYYEKHSARFDPSQSVDARLLNNLRSFRDQLNKGVEKLTTRDAHAFIGRILFLCYLLDRDIVSLEEPEKRTPDNRTGTMMFANALKNQPADSRIYYLYKLFGDLKERFNGNMFDQDLEEEEKRIRSSHIDKLIYFLAGHEVESRQLVLCLWPYDFKMIPIETISAIYQDFLSKEDPEKQKKRGAIYTPRFLAEMVVDVAIRGEPDALTWSFLDPACGSGIFLVIIFNRLANHWINRQADPVDYVSKAKALKEIFFRQIRGVDLEETACRIACFSLYLAYLDFFDPPDIQHYIKETGQPLPKLLDYGDDAGYPSPDIPVIQKGDFLSENLLPREKFDCIIGNPPWEGRQGKQAAQKFARKSPIFLKKDGTGCLLLPAKILQNQTDSFQAEWLRQVTLEKVFQLADYRHVLFKNAKCPAIIARFKKTIPILSEHQVEFVAPKFNRDGLRQGAITVNPTSRTWLPLTNILTSTKTKTAPVVWKRRLWGTRRDQKLLDLLQSLPPLKDYVDVLSELKKRRAMQKKRWLVGQGIKPWPLAKTTSDRQPKKIRWSLDMRFVEAKPWTNDLMLFEIDTISFREKLEKNRYRTDILYSQPSEDLFHPPMVLVNQGFDNVAYCDLEVLFQDSLQSITGPPEDADLLMFLAAYLRSNLARYFLFHTSANWGAERPKVHLFELLRVPFVLPGNEFISSSADEIIQEVVRGLEQLRTDLQQKREELEADSRRNYLLDNNDKIITRKWREERKKLVDTMQLSIEPLIYRYFNLTKQEKNLIEDTNCIFEPSATPKKWRSKETVTLDPLQDTKVEPYASRGLKAYADTLTNTLNSWARAEGSKYRVRAEGGTDNNTGLVMVSVILSGEEKVYQQKTPSKALYKILRKYYEEVTEDRGILKYERDILLFNEERIHIVRPNILFNWTRTAALNDAARIYGEIILRTEDQS